MSRVRWKQPVARCGAAALMAWSASCRSDGGPGRDVQAVHVTDVRGHLEFIARVRKNDQNSKISENDLETKEEIYEESIKIETEGSVYHPNLLEYSLAGLFGLTQQDFTEITAPRTRTSGDDGDIYEFDFEGRFLKKKPYPGTVYASRRRAIEPRPFLPSLETTTTNYGFVWQYVDPKMPTNLQFNSTTVELDPLDDEEEDGRQENSLLRFETEYRFTDHNVLSFTYSHQTVDEEPFELEYDTDEATFAHRLDFGEGNRHRLETELNIFDQTGTFDIERTRFREILRLTHSDTLRSWYQFEYMDRSQGSLAGVPPIDEESLLLSGTVEHELYESLESQVFAFVQRQNFDAGLDILRYGIQPGFDYRKKNPWGVLLADYRFRVQEEDRDGGAIELEVLNETRTFRDPEPIVLTNPNIVLSSIFITAEDRLTRYVEAEDYRVRRVGDTLEIERIPTGRILDGQTVLIDYVFVIGGDFTLDTTTHDFGIRQNLTGGLSPYYRFRDQDQDLTPADATGVTPEDITAHIVGLEFQRGDVRTVAEYEDHDSNINPFRAVRLSADLTRRFQSGGTGRLRSRWTDMDRSGDQDRRTRFFTIEGRMRQPIGHHLTVEGAVLYRTEEDSVSGDDEGVDVDLALEWLIRQTEVRLTYEYGQFEDDFAETRNSALFVQVKRRF